MRLPKFLKTYLQRLCLEPGDRFVLKMYDLSTLEFVEFGIPLSLPQPTHVLVVGHDSTLMQRVPRGRWRIVALKVGEL